MTTNKTPLEFKLAGVLLLLLLAAKFLIPAYVQHVVSTPRVITKESR